MNLVVLKCAASTALNALYHVQAAANQTMTILLSARMDGIIKRENAIAAATTLVQFMKKNASLLNMQ
jgi:hypothetical protein